MKAYMCKLRLKGEGKDFPAGPVVKDPPANARDTGSIPGQGTKIPHARGNQVHVPQLPSLRATAKILRAATKAQGSQIKNQQKASHSHPPSVQMK